MWRWKSLHLSPLLRHARNGEKQKLQQLADQGQCDLFNATHFLHNDPVGEDVWSIRWVEWRAHVYAWLLFIESLAYLADGHRNQFADDRINDR